MKKRISTKLACLFLALTMLVGFVPASIFAVDEEIHDHAHASSDEPIDEPIADTPSVIGNAAGGGKILVVQDDDPWDKNSNYYVMQSLQQKGYISGYKIVSTYSFGYENFSDYDVILMVSSADVTSYSSANSTFNAIDSFVKNGGTVIYNIAWYSSNSYYYTNYMKLPLDIKAINESDQYNIVVDTDHEIVTGSLTGGNNNLGTSLYGKSVSHTCISESSLPANANVIFRSKSNSQPTLVEYPMGAGNVIISCLTWEFFYNNEEYHKENIYFSTEMYDDLFVYALALANGLSDHDHELVKTGEPVEPNCNTDGYQLHVCSICGYEYREFLTPRLGHITGEWIIDTEPTCTISGLKHTECSRCNTTLEDVYMPALGHNYTSVVTREATCTQPGIITHTCSTCYNSYITYVYSEHVYAMTEYVAASCESDGYYLYECERCDGSYKEIIPGGHSYISEITKPASKEEDGEITYTCEKCDDSYTEVIPQRPDASILLIQDKFPWSEKSNNLLLDALVTAGYITGWDTASSKSLDSIELSEYKVILIANDQSSETYANLERFADLIDAYVRGGGVVIYGASDSGWSGGKINYALPGGVIKGNYYSNRNYIVNSTHSVITGMLTDGKALTDELLYGTYASHAYFTNLPEGAITLLADANGRATLVEYQLGDGFVIASGLTWEYSFVRNLVGSSSYAKTIYDDLILYAAMLSSPCDHVYDGGVTVDPTCESEGYVLHTCESCGGTIKNSFTEKLAHTPGDWEIETEATVDTNGLKVIVCKKCEQILDEEIIPAIGAAYSKVEPAGQITVGQPAEFTVSVSGAGEVTSLEISVLFDPLLFELVGVEWIIGVSSSEFDAESGTVKAYFDSATIPSGAILKIILKPIAPTDSAEVSVGMTMTNGESTTTATGIPTKTETAPCNHTYYSIVDSDGTFHVTKCDGCGMEAASAHSYKLELPEDKHLAKAQTCTDAPLYYYSCECGAHGTETFSYGEAPNGTHSFGDWTVTVVATTTRYGERERTCQSCGEVESEMIEPIDGLTVFELLCVVGDTIIGKKGATSLIIGLVDLFA